MMLGYSGVVGIPRWARRNLNRNESAVIAALKNISSAQAQLQASGALDVDGNGQGEYGFFAELSGRVALRGMGKCLAPPVLSAAFGEVVDSRVSHSDYVFQMFLPDSAERGVVEDASGGDVSDDSRVDATRAEVLWCCYAWPRSHGWSGKRAFFINQGGDVLTTNGRAIIYEGADRPCPFEAAFAGSAEPTMKSPIAANTVGQDGNTWVIV